MWDRDRAGTSHDRTLGPHHVEPSGRGARAPGAGRRGVTTPTAARTAWTAMQTLVTETNDRRREVADALDMSFVRVKALRRLAAAPVTIRELADSLITDAPYTTVVVDDLERRGLVKRRVDQDDRRRRIVAVTPEGARQAARASEILDDPPAALLALPPDDLAALERILTSLLPPPAERPVSNPGRRHRARPAPPSGTPPPAR
jgi:DNA-binding MarR family transcriptional regulator